MNDFAGKTVVITGAGSGMGRAYAMAFAKRGAKLALNDFQEQGLKETHQLVHAQHPNCQIFTCIFDVSDLREMQRFAIEVQSLLGPAQVLINNAGIMGAAKPFYTIGPDEFKKVMNVNFYGVFNGTQAFLPQLISQDEAALVNVSSAFGLLGAPNNTDYSASKFAVRGFTEALMAEFYGTSLEIYGVFPGGVSTNLVSGEEFEAYRQKHLRTPPEDLVAKVMSSMARKQPIIVYGQGSKLINLASRLFPRKLISRLLWNSMKEHFRADDYRKFRDFL